eukprot:3227956-Lingulodinium_polyedra.AAC.1
MLPPLWWSWPCTCGGGRPCQNPPGQRPPPCLWHCSTHFWPWTAPGCWTWRRPPLSATVPLAEGLGPSAGCQGRCGVGCLAEEGATAWHEALPDGSCGESSGPPGAAIG